MADEPALANLRQSAQNPLEKTSTGVENLDPLLGGGFPRGSIVVYYGPPSTGKTICSIAFLAAGVAKGERVLYVTFEEGERQILRLIGALGLDLKDAIKNGRFMIRDFTRFVSERGVEQGIVEKIREDKVSRVVIDSLSTAIIDTVRSDSVLAIKRFIVHLFRTLREEDITILLISRDEMEFETAVGLADCAIFFQPHAIGDQGLSSCTITKVRLARHNRNLHYLEIRKEGHISIRSEGERRVMQ